MRIIEAIAMGFMLSQITDNLPSLIYFGISHAKCTTINWPAHSPRSAFTFCLIKKQQKIKSAKRLLCRTGLCPQTGQNHGLESFALLRSLLPPLQQNFLCPYHAQNHHCSARFRPKLFCRRRDCASSSVPPSGVRGLRVRD
jgi:hypothetical protein